MTETQKIWLSFAGANGLLWGLLAWATNYWGLG